MTRTIRTRDPRLTWLPAALTLVALLFLPARADDEISFTRPPTRSELEDLTRELGVAAFGGVAYLPSAAGDNRPLPSGGAGLRFRLDPRTRSTIRVDYARGASGQSGLYVAFNEAL